VKQPSAAVRIFNVENAESLANTVKAVTEAC
jgi:hypothetical protein